MPARADRRDAALLAALLLLLAAVSLARPLLPIDETRYASVAWEMWTRGDFLVPHRNGEAYHHKPPLLFWLIHAGWAVFGVNEWWPRLISPLFAAGTLWLTHRLGRRLWPQRPQVAQLAPYVLLSSLLFAYFATALMFDAMLAFFVALGLFGLVVAWQDGGARGFVWLVLALVGALYAKGPVALLHLLPAALAAPWWATRPAQGWQRWYAGVGLALLAAAALILAWAVPAAIAGGPAYGDAIFWGQTAGRVTSSFAHQAPFWFYLAWLPLMLLPWLTWPRCWRGLAPARREGLLAEPGSRLMLFTAGFALLAFSLVSGKRWHYLLPEFAPFALLAARVALAAAPRRIDRALPAAGLVLAGVALALAAPRLRVALAADREAVAVLIGAGVALGAIGLGLGRWRVRSPAGELRALAVAMVLAYAAGMAAADLLLRAPFDVGRTAQQLARYEAEGRPVAIVGDYHGQWHLAGRLQRPLQAVPHDGGAAWLAAHPDGRLLVVHKRDDELPAGARVEFEQPRYRGSRLTIVAAP